MIAATSAFPSLDTNRPFTLISTIPCKIWRVAAAFPPGFTLVTTNLPSSLLVPPPPLPPPPPPPPLPPPSPSPLPCFRKVKPRGRATFVKTVKCLIAAGGGAADDGCVGSSAAGRAPKLSGNATAQPCLMQATHCRSLPRVPPEHSLQMTWPHCLQWCLRTKNVNVCEHCMQLGASTSSTQPSPAVALKSPAMLFRTASAMPTGVQTVSTPIWTSAAVGRPFHVEMKFKKEKKKKEM